MKFKKVLIGVVLALALVSLPFIITKATHAQGQSNTQDEMSAKLDQILNNQKTILQGIAELKNELYIIKIRVTQQQ